MTLVFQSSYAIADFGPNIARQTADVDDVGTVVSHPIGQLQNLLQLHSGCVVDFRNDLDIPGTEVGSVGLRAEIFG
jgi:hypothetical protein